MSEVKNNILGSGDGTQIKTSNKTENIKEIENQLADMNLENNNNYNQEIRSQSNSESESLVRRQVVKRGITGKIKWFNVARGYGFIERNDNEQDVFLHQSAVVRRGRKLRYSLFLKGGEDVEFDVVEGLKGLEAGAVSAPDGLELFTYNHRAKRAVGEDGQKNNRGHLRPRRPYKARKNQKKQSDQKTSGDEHKPEEDKPGENIQPSNTETSNPKKSEPAEP